MTVVVMSSHLLNLEVAGTLVDRVEGIPRLVGDSDRILVGTAGDQRAVPRSGGSAMTFTMTCLAVEDVVGAGGATSAGSTARVRQTTTAQEWTSAEPGAPLLPGIGTCCSRPPGPSG